METPGYRIPLHQSLTTPILLAGLPRRLAILHTTIAAAVVLGLQEIYLLPVFLVTHLLAMLLTKHDAYFFEVILRHLRKKLYYDV